MGKEEREERIEICIKIRKKWFRLINEWFLICYRYNRCVYNNLECVCSLSLCKNVYKEEEDDYSIKWWVLMLMKWNVYMLNESC